MTSGTKTFRETEKQFEALDLLGSVATNILLYGGSRSGKTFILLCAIVARALKAKSRHLVLRFRFNHVKTSVWHDTLPKVLALMFQELPVKWNHTDYFVEFQNGSQIWIGGLDDKARTEKVLGTEYSTMFFNECTQITYESVQTALTRLAEKSGLVNKAYFDCNPAGTKHWAYRMFIEGVEPTDVRAHPRPELYASLLMNPEDNEENLPDEYIGSVLGVLSRRKRERFQFGKWLDKVEGALWDDDIIPHIQGVPECDRIVIGVDPAASSGESADETGIIVAGRWGDNGGILDDLSDRLNPNAWGHRAIDACEQWRADLIAGEVNNGGEMVENTLRTIDHNVSFKKVWASRGKKVRAEPIASLYREGRIVHCGVFPELEDQMCSWDPTKTKRENGFSPDRMDAAVWALTELFLAKGKKKAKVF